MYLWRSATKLWISCSKVVVLLREVLAKVFQFQPDFITVRIMKTCLLVYAKISCLFHSSILTRWIREICWLASKTHAHWSWSFSIQYTERGFLLSLLNSSRRSTALLHSFSNMFESWPVENQNFQIDYNRCCQSPVANPHLPPELVQVFFKKRRGKGWGAKLKG